MDERFMDAMLNIKTAGNQMGFSQSLYYHPYEPTPYEALEILFQQYELKSSDRLVDFGCGKGRLNFYAHYFFHTNVTGVEMNEDFFQEAMKNKQNYFKRSSRKQDKMSFYCCLAEEYKINPLDNRFYFFNPFSIQIFMKVVKNILLSFEETQRELELILYYPSEDYIFYLNSQTPFELKEEIVLPGLFEKNPNERFLIYQLET